MLKKIIFTLFGMVFLLSSFVLAEPFDGPIPDNFNQAPEFDEMVEKGDLPPVEERLPKDPYVVDPNESIGEYGGTLNSATFTINQGGEETLVMDLMNSFVKPNPDGSEIIPNFAKDIESSEDMSTYTIYLREGVKWSDGEPFTTDDILFWYEDLLLNEEYTPAIPNFYKDADNEVMELDIIDDYTFRVEFGSPKPFFKNTLVHETGWNWIVPKHHLKEYHPEYVSEEELEEKLDEYNYDSWYELLGYMDTSDCQVPMIPERPTLTAYKLVEKSSDRRVYERNPYFWKVDKEGNQLPYIERVDVQLVSDREVLNGKIMSGEIDFAGAQTDIRNYPMFREYEEEGDYKTITMTNGYASDVLYMFNLTHKDSDLREIFQNVDFRRAMSLGIDRDEINETIYFGKAEPRQFTVLESSKYFEEEFEKAYVEYDPQRAEDLLDEVGLKDRDGDGWRELPNGDNFSFTIEYVDRETPKSPNVELVVQHWQDLGIDVSSKEISGELAGQRAPANEMDAYVWHGDKGTDILFPINAQFVVPYTTGWETSIWPEWATWFSTEGDGGEEPPEEIKELNSWWNEMLIEPDPDKRIELGKRILSTQAENLWSIGTVGGSPSITIVDNDLNNVPEEVIMVWDTIWTTTRDPEQFYFTDGENNE